MYHEEADTRIILHLEDAVKDGNDKLSIRTVDTDVVLLAVTALNALTFQNCGLRSELESTFDSWLLMKWPGPSIQIAALHYQCFIHLLAAIRYPVLVEEARRQHGTPGKCTKKLQKHSVL